MALALALALARVFIPLGSEETDPRDFVAVAPKAPAAPASELVWFAAADRGSAAVGMMWG